MYIFHNHSLNQRLAFGFAAFRLAAKLNAKLNASFSFAAKLYEAFSFAANLNAANPNANLWLRE
jgi:hypothetical protein